MEQTTWTRREVNNVLERSSQPVRAVQMEQDEPDERPVVPAPLELDEIEPYVRGVLNGLDSTLTDGEHQAAAALARTLAADAVRVVRVRREAAADADLADPDGAIHRAFAAHRPLAVWVRPDKYVGFRGDPRSTGALRAYLEGMFAGAARPRRETP